MAIIKVQTNARCLVLFSERELAQYKIEARAVKSNRSSSSITYFLYGIIYPSRAYHLRGDFKTVSHFYHAGGSTGRGIRSLTVRFSRRRL